MAHWQVQSLPLGMIFNIIWGEKLTKSRRKVNLGVRLGAVQFGPVPIAFSTQIISLGNICFFIPLGWLNLFYGNGQETLFFVLFWFLVGVRVLSLVFEYVFFMRKARTCTHCLRISSVIQDLWSWSGPDWPLWAQCFAPHHQLGAPYPVFCLILIGSDTCFWGEAGRLSHYTVLSSATNIIMLHQLCWERASLIYCYFTWILSMFMKIYIFIKRIHLSILYQFPLLLVQVTVNLVA